jgi:CheY-like chemotaxis protein
MAKSGKKDKVTFDDWMERVSFAEEGDTDDGLEITGLDVAQRLALDEITVVKSERPPTATTEEGEAETMKSNDEPMAGAAEGRISVMIVDDEPIVGKRLKPALAKHGFDVEVFESPTEALKRLGEKEFDIVVTDLRMEEVDGIQVLEHIMSSKSNTRVVLITGYATVDVAREALVKGAFDFIAKPFKPKDLKAVINKAALSLGYKGIQKSGLFSQFRS